MKYVIFDLDGTLADDRRRRLLIDPRGPNPSFDAYHADCANDPLINSHLIGLINLYEPIIFTSRPETVFHQTLKWLRDVAEINVDVRRIFMRPRGCLKSSPELKQGFLEMLLKDGAAVSEIACAFDDRDDVLAVYKHYGIAAEKVGYPAEVKSPDKNLSAGAETFQKRNAVYGGSYLTFGAVMSALFPNGLKIDSQDINAFNRLGVFVQIVSKCCRYSAKFSTGGHSDSAHDLMVYAAILESLTEENSNGKF